MRSRMTRMVSPFVLCAVIVFVFPVAFETDQSFGDIPQPMMGLALHHLEKAKDFLEKAVANKGGHRAKAMFHVNKALEEVKKGMSFANKQMEKK